MGSYLHYECPSCRFRASVGGPEEFYLAPSGERLAHGHPEPVSPEAEARGVDGFWMHLWCAACRRVQRVITLEFVEPCGALAAWSGRGLPKPGYPAPAEACPACGEKLDDEIPGLDPICPGCRQGVLATRHRSD